MVEKYNDDALTDGSVCQKYSDEMQKHSHNVKTKSVLNDEKKEKIALLEQVLIDIGNNLFSLLDAQLHNLNYLQKLNHSTEFSKTITKIKKVNQTHINYVNILYEFQLCANELEYKPSSMKVLKNAINNEIDIIECYENLKKYEQNSKVKHVLNALYKDRFLILKQLLVFV